MSFRLAKARREASRQTKDQHRHQETEERFGQEQGPKLRSQETHEQGRAKPGFNPQNNESQERNHQQAWEAPNRQKKAEEEIRRQEQEAIARINRQKADIEADLRRKEEALKQEQARTYKGTDEPIGEYTEAGPGPDQAPRCLQDFRVCPCWSIKRHGSVWFSSTTQTKPLT